MQQLLTGGGGAFPELAQIVTHLHQRGQGLRLGQCLFNALTFCRWEGFLSTTEPVRSCLDLFGMNG